MENYQDLLKQREVTLAELASLDQKIDQARLAEIKTVIAELRDLITEHNVTHDQLFPQVQRSQKRRGASPMKGSKAVPRSHDPVTGVAWTGRGRAPKWFDKENVDQFKIAD